MGRVKYWDINSVMRNLAWTKAEYVITLEES